MPDRPVSSLKALIPDSSGPWDIIEHQRGKQACLMATWGNNKIVLEIWEGGWGYCLRLCVFGAVSRFDRSGQKSEHDICFCFLFRLPTHDTHRSAKDDLEPCCIDQECCPSTYTWCPLSPLWTLYFLYSSSSQCSRVNAKMSVMSNYFLLAIQHTNLSDVWVFWNRRPAKAGTFSVVWDVCTTQ